MDFFEAQERAHRRTTRLVVLFSLAVAGTILAFYAAALFLLAWLTSDQVTAILVESGTIERGVIPNRWGPILIVLASAYAISALVWLVLRVRRGS